MKMLKVFCSVVSVVALASCGGPQYIQQSDVAVTTKDLKAVYFKVDPIGVMIYNTWVEGAYGDTTQVYLLVGHEFERYVKKSKKN